MTERVPELTRRQVLGAVAGTGAVGATTGVTVARLSDRESAPVTLQAGELSVHVTCETDRCFASGDGTVGFAFDGLEPGTGGSETFELSVVDNPARLWFRTTCPPAVDPLGEVMEVTLAIDGGGGELFAGSLNDLRTEFSDGIRLDDVGGGPCLSPDESLSLEFEYELPDDADWTMDLRSELGFELFAEQCRHVPEEEVDERAPFESEECPELECPEDPDDCVLLGKLDVDEDLEADVLEPGTRYAFSELADEFDDGHEYELQVLTVTNKEDEDETVCASFRLLRDGEEPGAPPICEVEVAGGPDPGSDSTGPQTVEYEVDPPTTRTRGEVCTAEADSGISHLTVYVCPDGAGDGGEAE